MSRTDWRRRRTAEYGEAKPIRGWNLAGRFVLAMAWGGAVFYALSKQMGDKQPLRETVVWVIVVGIGVLLLGFWQHLQPRQRTQQPRFTRIELMRATFSTLLLLSVFIVPDVVVHRVSSWRWVLLPFLALALFAGFVWADREDDRKVEADLAEWRRVRPQTRPKAR
ncbi:MAG: hypothetical protein QOF95_3200 [Pseudonocardiales bacterium]|jgi:MFS family permease|nr:hypothetical protein [Pseudonocardiales bacterium]